MLDKTSRFYNMPFKTKIIVTTLLWISCSILQANSVKQEQFAFRPAEQWIHIGHWFHQACSYIETPISITWYRGNDKLGSCIFTQNITQMTTHRVGLEISIGLSTNHDQVCHLAIRSAQVSDSGEYQCVAIKSNVEQASASAKVLVHTPISSLKLTVKGEKGKMQLSTQYGTDIECVVLHRQPDVSLRLELGGDSVKTMVGNTVRQTSGAMKTRLAGKIMLRNWDQWKILVCHVDIAPIPSVNRTFTVINLDNYVPSEYINND